MDLHATLSHLTPPLGSTQFGLSGTNILAWRIPWTEEPGWLSLGSQSQTGNLIRTSQVALVLKNLPAVREM